MALVELLERPGANAVPRRGRPGLYHFAILLPTRPALGAFLGHLREREDSFAGSDHLVSEALYLHDPDGLGIEVYADRPREDWRSAGGQLVMATEPLDVASLARAAEGASWKGAPEGTTVGHVHLHVGDLERAAAFYHEALGLDKTGRLVGSERSNGGSRRRSSVVTDRGVPHRDRVPVGARASPSLTEARARSPPPANS